MKLWLAAGVAAALAMISFAVFAEPPKRAMSIWDFMRAYHAVVQEEQIEQEPQKVQEPARKEHKWHGHKPRPPCWCGPQIDYGGAVNYPPYDLEP